MANTKVAVENLESTKKRVGALKSHVATEAIIISEQQQAAAQKQAWREGLNLAAMMEKLSKTQESLSQQSLVLAPQPQPISIILPGGLSLSAADIEAFNALSDQDQAIVRDDLRMFDQLRNGPEANVEVTNLGLDDDQYAHAAFQLSASHAAAIREVEQNAPVEAFPLTHDEKMPTPSAPPADLVDEPMLDTAMTVGRPVPVLQPMPLHDETPKEDLSERLVGQMSQFASQVQASQNKRVEQLDDIARQLHQVQRVQEALIKNTLRYFASQPKVENQINSILLDKGLVNRMNGGPTFLRDPQQLQDANMQLKNNIINLAFALLNPRPENSMQIHIGSY